MMLLGAGLLRQVTGPLESSPSSCPWEVLPVASFLLCDSADVDECEDLQSSCLGGECKNMAGSYQCLCPRGFQLVNGTVCEGELLRSPHQGLEEVSVWGGGSIPRRPTAYLLPADVDECVGDEYCAPHGECLNSQGSFFCLCAPGFASAEGGTSCLGEKPAWPCPLASSRGC